MDEATLNNVLPRSIVINNCRGEFKRLMIYLLLIFLFSCSMFFRLNENNATSEPEKRADNKSNIIRIKN